MKREIYLSAALGETRAAMVEDGTLVEYSLEGAADEGFVGNIYKGKVENVLPGMQAAFVNIGLDRNGFLHVDDAVLDPPADGPAHRTLNIREVVWPGEPVVVQVVKAPTGTKGARVSRHLSLPGRYVVLLPGQTELGISRRIEASDERERLKGLAEALCPPGYGLIVRTVAEGVAEAELAQDIERLLELHQRVQRQAASAAAPSLLHQESGLVGRVVRDWVNEAVEVIWVEGQEVHAQVKELLSWLAPAALSRLRLWHGQPEGLFEFHGFETQLEKALGRRVWLKSGGYLVIDPTEALTVIDVNTGKYVGSQDLNETVLKTNLEAAAEIARQLRLRELGGIIIVDFIDMEVAEHRQAVLAALEAAVAADRTRTTVLGLTQLGLVELTRKKSRQPLLEALSRPCPACEGRGRVLTEAAVARRARRELRQILAGAQADAVLFETHPLVAGELIGPGGSRLQALEAELGGTIYIKGNSQLAFTEFRLARLGTRAEVEALAIPVRLGQRLELLIEEAHANQGGGGIARLDGYVIDVEGAAKRVGERLWVEITRVQRTSAKARAVT